MFFINIITEKEQWKKIYIKNKITKYSISSYGNIKNEETNYILHPAKDSDGYLIVSLYLNSKRYIRKMHRLVGIAFIPNPENKPTVNHKDGVKSNNYVYNLEWATYSEQMVHAFELGLVEGGKGEKNSMCKYSEKIIHNICELLENGYNRSKISKQLEIPKSLIQRIVLERSWTHISSLYNIDPKKSKTPYSKGQEHYHASCNEEMIHSVCKLLEEGKLSIKEISKKLNISKYIIKHILYNNTWKQISSQYNVDNFKKYRHNTTTNKEKSSTTIENNMFIINIKIGKHRVSR